MNKRTHGKTGLNVTCLGFGAMEIGKLDLKDAETLLNEVLDQGITLIDSSPCYGRAEEYIGRAISHRRDEFVVEQHFINDRDERKKANSKNK